MNSRAIGWLAAAAAFAAAIVISDPGGAGNIAAPTAVADATVSPAPHLTGGQVERVGTNASILAR